MCCRTAQIHCVLEHNHTSIHSHERQPSTIRKGKVKAFPYSIPSVGSVADPGVQAVSPQLTVSHPPGGRLQLLFVRPAVTSSAAEHHRHLAGRPTKLYCLMTEAHRCEQLAQGCYTALPRVGFEPGTYWSQVKRSTRCTTAPPEIFQSSTVNRQPLIYQLADDAANSLKHSVHSTTVNDDKWQMKLVPMYRSLYWRCR